MPCEQHQRVKEWIFGIKTSLWKAQCPESSTIYLTTRNPLVLYKLAFLEKLEFFIQAVTQRLQIQLTRQLWGTQLLNKPYYWQYRAGDTACAPRLVEVKGGRGRLKERCGWAADPWTGEIPTWQTVAPIWAVVGAGGAEILWLVVRHSITQSVSQSVVRNEKEC